MKHPIADQEWAAKYEFRMHQNIFHENSSMFEHLSGWRSAPRAFCVKCKLFHSSCRILRVKSAPIQTRVLKISKLSTVFASSNVKVFLSTDAGIAAGLWLVNCLLFHYRPSRIPKKSNHVNQRPFRSSCNFFFEIKKDKPVSGLRW